MMMSEGNDDDEDNNDDEDNDEDDDNDDEDNDDDDDNGDDGDAAYYLWRHVRSSEPPPFAIIHHRRDRMRRNRGSGDELCDAYEQNQLCIQQLCKSINPSMHPSIYLSIDRSIHLIHPPLLSIDISIHSYSPTQSREYQHIRRATN